MRRKATQGRGGSSGGHARSKQGGGAKLSFRYDPETDVLLIEGVKYSGELFRQLAKPDDGALHRLIQNEDGVVVMSGAKWNQAFDDEAGDGAGLEI